MKEWLEEKDMPKDCASCKYYVLNCSDSYHCIKQNGKAIHCNFSDGMGYRHEDCPFQSLADYTKQVRKEVVQEIWKEFEQRLMNKTKDMPVMKVANMINSVLDQIQGETNGDR